MDAVRRRYSRLRRSAQARCLAVARPAEPGCLPAACPRVQPYPRSRPNPHPSRPAQAVRDLLAAIPYSDNDIYLHSDPTLMPKNTKTWASWNFLGASGAGADT